MSAPPSDSSEPVAPAARRYASASSRGIENELLLLLEGQLPLLRQLHAQGSLAPLAASMAPDGETQHRAFTREDGSDPEVAPTVEDVIIHFRQKFREEARAGSIVACGVFLHGCHGPGRGALGVPPARAVDEADCIVAILEHADGQAVAAVIQYRRRAGGGWHYDPAYFVPIDAGIFVDPQGNPLVPSSPPSPRLPLRPTREGDGGVHPEMMILLEAHSALLPSLQASGSPAPVAAWMKPSGEVQTGIVSRKDAWERLGAFSDPDGAVVAFHDAAAEKSPANAIAFFVERLRAAADRGELVATAIFYHARYDPELARLGLMPAGNGETPDCLVAQLDHRLSQAMSVVIRYGPDPDGSCRYEAPVAYPNYPLIFNEMGGPYAEHVAMMLAEALRAYVAEDANDDPDWWHRRLRPLLPAGPLEAAYLDPILGPMLMENRVAVLLLLAELGRNEVQASASALLAGATEVERVLLERVIARCGTSA